jgi:outer membrane protein TolC
MRRYAFIMLIATVASGPAALSGRATPPPVPQTLSLRQAVEFANRYNPAMRQAAAREGLTLATDRYQIGSGIVFDLLDAQVTTETAERDYINAVYAYHQAIAMLQAAVGRPLR